MANFSHNFAGAGALRAESIEVVGSVTAAAFNGDLTGNVNAATVVASTSVSTPTMTTSGTRISLAAGKVLRLDTGGVAAPSLEVGADGVGVYGVASAVVLCAAGSAYGQWANGGFQFLNAAPLFNQGLRFANQTAPGAPANNEGIVYGVDNAGKDRIAARFATGAVQPIATEP